MLYLSMSTLIYVIAGYVVTVAGRLKLEQVDVDAGVVRYGC